MKAIEKIYIHLFVLGCMLLILPLKVNAQKMDTNNEKLVVLWVSGDPVVAEKSCLMYTHAAKKDAWFDEVVLIVWGSSSRLLAENEVLQKKVKAMIEDGVILEACMACSESLGVTKELKALGIDVKGMGVTLSNYMKSGYHVLSY